MAPSPWLSRPVSVESWEMGASAIEKQLTIR